MAEDALAEAVIERYAKAKGLDVEEAKKKLKPVLKAEAKPDKLTEGLLKACDTLGRIKEVGDGAGVETQAMLSKLATAVVSRALTGEGSQGNPVDEGIGEASKYIAKIKMIDRAFGEDESKRMLFNAVISTNILGPIGLLLSSAGAEQFGSTPFESLAGPIAGRFSDFVTALNQVATTGEAKRLIREFLKSIPFVANNPAARRQLEEAILEAIGQ